MRLILNRRTDYAFRALMALASEPGRRRSASRIAAEMVIPPAYVGPIMADLMHAGLVSGATGRAGGYELARSPDDIVLREVIESLEPGESLTLCSLADRNCNPQASCALHPIWAAASAAYLETFGSVTLATLAATDAAVRQGGMP